MFFFYINIYIYTYIIYIILIVYTIVLLTILEWSWVGFAADGVGQHESPINPWMQRIGWWEHCHRKAVNIWWFLNLMVSVVDLTPQKPIHKDWIVDDGMWGSSYWKWLNHRPTAIQNAPNPLIDLFSQRVQLAAFRAMVSTEGSAAAFLLRSW